ncbi:MAG: PilN domain-containing protein [Ignavibacteriales bacterium]|nr:PilN domain-containing protein [Ignavibacteriales bacterium]
MTTNSRSIKNILAKFSFLRTAGVNKLLLIDIHSSVVKFVCIKSREPFYQLSKSKELRKIEVIASERHSIDGDYSLIKTLLKKFIEQNSLHEIYTVIGINDFKFTSVTLPYDTDDVELWFKENTSKFLPEGRPANDFHFSFERYNHDENSKNFFVVVARADILSKIYDSCNTGGLRIISVSPFSLSLNLMTHFSEKNILFLDFTTGKIIYTLVNYSGSIFSGEFYSQNEMGSQRLNADSISNSLDELYSILQAAANDKSLENIHVYLSCESDISISLKEIISRIFIPETFNYGYESYDPFYTGSYLIYNKLFNEYDSRINLTNAELLGKERSIFEKQLSMRAILSGGMILITLLLFSYMAENFVTARLNDEQENILDSNTKAVQAENIKRENDRLNANLSMLYTLKGRKSKYSELLSGLTNIITDKSCFTSVGIKNIDRGQCDLEISGLAVSQQEIAVIISIMEKSSHFTNVALLFSSDKKNNEMRHAATTNSNLIQFKILAKYNADKE